MLKLKIIDKNKYVYNLLDEKSERKYEMNLEFLNIENQPEIGNYIYMKKELLNPKYEGYSTSYTFGELESKYGKENIIIEDIDVIKLIEDEKEIYLKRLYG